MPREKFTSVSPRIHGLPPKQAQFVLNYLGAANGNATKAAEDAGYKPGYGSLLLKNPAIAEAIRRQQTRISEKFEIDVSEVVRELYLLGMARMGDYLRRGEDGKRHLSLDDCTDEELAAVQSVEYEEVTVRAQVQQKGPSEVPVTDSASGVSIQKVKFKLHNKESALVNLLKHVGGQFDAKKDDADDGVLRVIIEGGLPE